jgi:hypothetical protein
MQTPSRLIKENVMNLPIQTQPVQRAVASYSALGGHAGAAASGISANGMVASGYGVDPSFDWGGLLGTVAKVAAPALASLI